MPFGFSSFGGICQRELERKPSAGAQVHAPPQLGIKVRLVEENLNTHDAASLYEAFPAEEARELAQRLDVQYTPKHGSWLTIAEMELSVLQTQCLNGRIPDIDAMRGETSAREVDRNQRANKTDWRCTAADVRIKRKQLCPKW